MYRVQQAAGVLVPLGAMYSFNQIVLQGMFSFYFTVYLFKSLSVYQLG